MVPRPLFAAALAVRRKYLMVLPRPLPAPPLVVRRRVLESGAQADARGAARCVLHVHARSAKTDACGRSFAVLSTQASTVGLRLR